MNLQQCCIKYGLNITKTARFVRQVILKSLSKDDKPLTERQLLAKSVDLVYENIGLSVHKRKRTKRFHYTVTNPDAFLRFVGKRLGASTLNDEDLKVVLAAARSFADLLAGRHQKGWVILDTSRRVGKSRRIVKGNPDYIRSLDRLLIKSGVL